LFLLIKLVDSAVLVILTYPAPPALILARAYPSDAPPAFPPQRARVVNGLLKKSLKK
jgi:hypothetical protein